MTSSSSPTARTHRASDGPAAGWRLVQAPLAEAERCTSIYAGQVLLFRGFPDFARLVEACHRRIEAALGSDEPPTAQHRLNRADFIARIDRLQRDFARDPEIAELFRAALAGFGVELERSYWDRLHLRVLPSGEGYGGPEGARRVRTLAAHRDTWGSNISAQTNWWAPLYPLTDGRTMALYPALWDRPVANDSADWDLEELKSQDRLARLNGRTESDYPRLPTAREDFDRAGEWRVLPEPGDMLCFSAAHLHASVPNESGATRFSLEARTVNFDDVRSDRGAPNVDGEAPHIPYEWFRHILRGSRLADDLIGALNGSEAG